MHVPQKRTYAAEMNSHGIIIENPKAFTTTNYFTTTLQQSILITKKFKK